MLCLTCARSAAARQRRQHAAMRPAAEAAAGQLTSAGRHAAQRRSCRFARPATRACTRLRVVAAPLLDVRQHRQRLLDPAGVEKRAGLPRGGHHVVHRNAARPTAAGPPPQGRRHAVRESTPTLLGAVASFLFSIGRPHNARPIPGASCGAQHVHAAPPRFAASDGALRARLVSAPCVCRLWRALSMATTACGWRRSAHRAPWLLAA